MTKYYWVNVWKSVYSKPNFPAPRAIETEENPIAYFQELQEWCHENDPPRENTTFAVLGWQEITKEEYEAWKNRDG